MLPPRPLRLRKAFVALAIGRAAVALAPALAVIAAACVWQARAAWEVADDARGWERGHEVEILESSHDERVIFGVVHDVVARASYVDPSGVERGGALRWLSVVDDGTRGPLEARFDPVRGRLVLSWAVEARAGRWGWIALAALLLGGLLAACAAAARAMLREYLVARRAARASNELELEVVELVTHDVHGKPSVLEVRYREPREEETIGYRESAPSSGDEVRCARFRLAEGGPILLDDGARVLALCPHGSREVTLVRDDLWPFVAQPPSVRAPASISSIGTQEPRSSNT